MLDLLDATLRDPIVTISRDKATISAVASSRQLDTWEIKEFGRVDVVTLDVSRVEPLVAGGQTNWPEIPAVANSQASEVFGNNYPTGIPVDTVSPSYTGPGGAPDFSEHFEAPGTLRLELEENAFSVPEDSPSGDNQRFSMVWADPEGLIAHRVETKFDVVFPPRGGFPTFTSTMTFQAFDLRQMRNVGEPLTVTADHVAFVDPSTGRIFLTEGVFTSPLTRRWVRYDAEQGRYVEEELAEPIPLRDPNSSRLRWDPVAERAYEIAGDPGAWSLFTYVEQSDGSWVRHEHPLPAAPGGDAGRRLPARRARRGGRRVVHRARRQPDGRRRAGADPGRLPDRRR